MIKENFSVLNKFDVKSGNVLFTYTAKLLEDKGRPSLYFLHFSLSDF